LRGKPIISKKKWLPFWNATMSIKHIQHTPTPALRNGNDFVMEKKINTKFALTSKTLIIFANCHGFI